MPKATCAVEVCDRPASARGWCLQHFKRWQRKGDPGTSAIQPRRTGCQVDGCEAPHSGRGYCQTHLYRLRSNGDPLVTRSPGSQAGADHPLFRGDDVRYHAVHRRLRETNGPAREQACVGCGQAAETWAYQHGAADERVCDKAGLPYSTDLSYYRPMCWPCHHTLDALHGWTQPDALMRGASFVPTARRWRAYVSRNGKQHHLGYHATREEALAAAAEKRHELLSDWEQAT